MKFLIAFFGLAAVAIASGCSSSSDGSLTTATNVSAAKPSTVMVAVGSAVAKTGTSMGAQGVAASSTDSSGSLKQLDISQDCSIHAQPLRAGVALAVTDPDYPGRFMYCKLAYNTEDPESVQGAFTQAKSISCLLEAAGIVWDGVPHTFTVTPSAPCFSANQLSNMGGTPSAMSVTATASMPAAFNTYYERGISIAITGMGNMKLAVNASDTKIEFIGIEDDTAYNAHHFDTYAASLDYSTGEIRYELRSDRYNDTTESSSGGFSRHQRIYASVTTSGQSVTGLKLISTAQNEIYNGAVQSGYGGQMVTASGDPSAGIKARFWHATGDGISSAATGVNDLTNPAKWVETTNSRCYTSSGATGTGCSSGVAIPTTNAANSFAFTQQGTGYTAGAAWASAHGAWTFTSVDPSVDTQ